MSFRIFRGFPSSDLVSIVIILSALRNKRKIKSENPNPTEQTNNWNRTLLGITLNTPRSKKYVHKLDDFIITCNKILIFIIVFKFFNAGIFIIFSHFFVVIILMHKYWFIIVFLIYSEFIVTIINANVC